MTTWSRHVPEGISRENLFQLFVGHEQILSAIVEGMKSTIRDGGARYELFVGPKGSGKSHLINLVFHHLSHELKAYKRVFLVPIKQDFYVGSIADLLSYILKNIEQQKTSIVAQAWMKGGSEGLDLLAASVEKALGGQPIVLFIDGLDDTFQAIGQKGQNELRAFLEKMGNCSIIGTSQRAGPAFTRQDKPFFGTFMLRQLSPLNCEQCYEMLRRIAQVRRDKKIETLLLSAKGMATVRVWYHLLDGWPGTMARLYSNLHLDSLDDPFQILITFADDLRPYHRQEMEQLSHGKRAVLEVIANNWRPLSVNEIAHRLYDFSPQTVSSHLMILKQENRVQAIKNGRESLYEIVDPLFCIFRAFEKYPSNIFKIFNFLYAWYREPGTIVEPDLGEASWLSWDASILEKNLTELCGLPETALEFLHLAIKFQKYKNRHKQIVTKARSYYLRCAAPERKLMCQFLEMAQATDVVAALPR